MSETYGGYVKSEYREDLDPDPELTQMKAVAERVLKEKALRYNEGKLKWSMVHFQSLAPMVRVLMYGEKKYTKSLNFELENILQVCNTVKIIQIEKLNQKDFVDRVMTSSSSWQIQATNRDKRQIRLDGIKRTLEEQERRKESERETTLQSSLRERNSSTEKDGYRGSMDSLLNTMNLSSYKDVLFVDQRSVYMLTIATKQEDSEEFCVVSAIRDLDCLMMIFQNLKKRQIISENIQVIGNQIIVTGRDNWKKGLNRLEILDSMQRHLAALIDGQEIDPESGEHHIGHIMCNCMFYSYFNIVGGDKSSE